jgi:hypothetical protein
MIATYCFRVRKQHQKLRATSDATCEHHCYCSNYKLLSVSGGLQRLTRTVNTQTAAEEDDFASVVSIRCSIAPGDQAAAQQIKLQVRFRLLIIIVVNSTRACVANEHLC